MLLYSPKRMDTGMPFEVMLKFARIHCGKRGMWPTYVKLSFWLCFTLITLRDKVDSVESFNVNVCNQ